MPNTGQRDARLEVGEGLSVPLLPKVNSTSLSVKGNRKVLIVGAGIGGLTTALHLHRVGVECQIVEAVPEFGPVGVGITILPHAAKQLRVLGLENALRKDAILTRESVFYNRFGQLIYRESTGRHAGYADPQYSIHRAHLHEVLLNAVIEQLGVDAVLSGYRVRAVEQNEQGATTYIDRADGSTVLFESDVVIAADGIHSAVRAQLFPNEGEPRYSGVMMWRGTTVWPAFLTGASMVRVGSLATGQLVCYPIRNDVDGRGSQLVNWVVELQMPQRSGREWTRQGNLEDFINFFTDWHFDWLDVPAMLAAADTILEYPMVDQDPLPRWSHGRITLLGDAAHPMVPRGSNGAGQTILDASAIGDCMAAQHGNSVAALQAYDDLRRPVTTGVVLASRVSSPDSILQLVYERTGDKPFARIEDVISNEELDAVSRSYKQVAGFTAEAVSP